MRREERVTVQGPIKKQQPDGMSRGGRGLACRLGCFVLVCSRWHLLADRHSPPFPWTLSLRRRRCPLASHRPVPSLSLLALSFPWYHPFLSLGLLRQRTPLPLLPFQRLRLTAKILLRRLWRREDLRLQLVGGPSEEGGPSQPPLQTLPPF